MTRSRARSLQLRLAIRLGLLFVVTTALAVGAILYQTYRTAASLGEQSLLDMAQDLAHSITTGPNDAALLQLSAAQTRLYESPMHVAVYCVKDAAGRTIAASGEYLDDCAKSQQTYAGHEPRFFRKDSLYDGRDYYGLSVVIDSAVGPLFVSVAQAGDIDDLFHALLEEFVVDVAWIVPVFIAATLLVGILAIRRGLRPLRGVSEQAALIAPGAAHVRLPEDGLPTEIVPLVSAVNRALDRLEHGFAVQRRFTADAAHELRTPLTIIMGALEGTDGHEDLAKLRQDVGRMTRLVEQLLRVARLDSLDLDVSGNVDLNEVAHDVVEYLAPSAIARDRSIALVRGPSAAVSGNRHAITDAVRNLVENAIGHTARGTEVVVQVAPAEVRVADRGPGVPPEDRSRIFDRFWRGAATQGTREGAGLGLAIVREIMKAHGGTVEVSDGPSGGAQFTLRFGATARQLGGAPSLDRDAAEESGCRTHQGLADSPSRI